MASVGQSHILALYHCRYGVFFDKKPEIIRHIVRQSGILLFTTMHGIAKILDRHADELHCRLALIEDGCYKIYQPKNRESCDSTSVSTCRYPTLRSPTARGVFLVPIFDRGIFLMPAPSSTGLLQILARLGFKTILISGLDMTNFSQPRFYETQQNQLPSYLATKVEKSCYAVFLHLRLTYCNKSRSGSLIFFARKRYSRNYLRKRFRLMSTSKK